MGGRFLAGLVERSGLRWRSAADGSRGDLLARAATRPLARDHRATLEDLAAPHAPGLVPLQRAGQARQADRALEAVALGELEVCRGLRESELRVLHSAGQLQAVPLRLERVEVERDQRGRRRDEHPFVGGTHRAHLLGVLSDGGRRAENTEAADPRCWDSAASKASRSRCANT